MPFFRAPASSGGGSVDPAVLAAKQDIALPTLASGTDPNTILTDYRGSVLGANTHANRPAGALDAVITVKRLKASSVLQMWEYAGSVDPSVWVRWYGGSWGAWRRIDGPPLVALTGGTDVNTVLGPALHSLSASFTYPNAPETAVGAIMATYYATATSGLRVWYGYSGAVFTAQRLSGGWQPWVRTDAPYAISIAKSYTDSKVVSSSGMKRVPLAVTLPSGASSRSSTATGGAVRFVRQYAHMPKRVRIHVANLNYGYVTNWNAANLSLDVRVGVGAADGGMTSAVQAASGLVVPGTVTSANMGTSAGEAVTPWVTVDSLTDGGYLAVSLAWTGADTTIQNNIGACWTTTNPAQVGDATVTGWTANATSAPFSVWIEAEVPARVPVVALVGDSIVCGLGSSAVPDQSFGARTGRQEGWLPMHIGMSGSTMDRWKLSTFVGWKMYPGIDLGVADAVLVMLGQNDLISTTLTLADLQAIHATLASSLSTLFPLRPVYLGEITPSNKAAAQEQIRRDYNTWRATLPYGERGVIRWASALSAGGLDEDMDPTYSSDGLHPNDSGVAVMVSALVARPVAPFTPTQSKLKSVLGSAV